MSSRSSTQPTNQTAGKNDKANNPPPSDGMTSKRNKLWKGINQLADTVEKKIQKYETSTPVERDLADAKGNTQKPTAYNSFNRDGRGPAQLDGTTDDKEDSKASKAEGEEQQHLHSHRRRRLSELKHRLNAAEKAGTDRLSEAEVEYDPKKVVDPVDQGLTRSGQGEVGRMGSGYSATESKSLAEQQRVLAELERWRQAGNGKDEGNGEGDAGRR